MSNTRYQRLREQKRCTRCREQDERTLQGFSVCESCKRKFAAYRREYLARPGIAEQQRISSKNTVNRRYHQRQRNLTKRKRPPELSFRTVKNKNILTRV